MGARTRDVVVVGVLVAGVAGAALVWHPVGRWASLVVALAAVVVAAVVYLLRPSAFPWRPEGASVLDAPREPSLEYGAWSAHEHDRPRGPDD